MSYKITIEETKFVDTITQRSWVRGGPDGRRDGEEYGYTPQIPVIDKKTVDVYMQVVEDIDLAAVIMAINSPAAQRGTQ